MAGFRLLKGLAPIEEAMAGMSFIDVVMPGKPSCGGNPAAASGKVSELGGPKNRHEQKQRGRPSHGDRKPGSRHRHDEGDGCPGQGGKRRHSGVRRFRTGGPHGIHLRDGTRPVPPASSLQIGGRTLQRSGRSASDRTGRRIEHFIAERGM